MATTTHDVSYVFIELGLVIVGLAVLARLASRWVFSVLVQEDLALAVYLPLVAVLLSGGGAAKIVLSVFVAIAVVSLVALGGRAIWTSAKPACRSRIRRNHSADDLRCRAAGGWC